jgi:uncharacterized protein (TIGR03083 family)
MLGRVTPETPWLGNAVRNALSTSARWFADVVGDIAQDQWSAPGLGEWTVLELVGHCSRNCRLVIDHLDVSGRDVPILGPFVFWDVVLATGRAEAHADIAARAAGYAEDLGPDPAGSIRSLVDALIERVDRATDGTPLRFGDNGSLALIDMLPSRVVEFVAHGVDLCEAIGRSHADVPVPAARLSAEVLASYGDPVSVVKALTGRGDSPANVFM